MMTGLVEDGITGDMYWTPQDVQIAKMERGSWDLDKQIIKMKRVLDNRDVYHKFGFDDDELYQIVPWGIEKTKRVVEIMLKEGWLSDEDYLQYINVIKQFITEFASEIREDEKGQERFEARIKEYERKREWKLSDGGKGKIITTKKADAGIDKHEEPDYYIDDSYLDPFDGMSEREIAEEEEKWYEERREFEREEEEWKRKNSNYQSWEGRSWVHADADEVQEQKSLESMKEIRGQDTHDRNDYRHNDDPKDQRQLEIRRGRGRTKGRIKTQNL